MTKSSRKQRIRTAIDATVVNLKARIVSKADLSRIYGFNNKDTVELIRVMLSERVIIEQDKAKSFAGSYYLVVEFIKKPQYQPLSKESQKMKKLYRQYGYGVCCRCVVKFPVMGRKRNQNEVTPKKFVTLL